MYIETRVSFIRTQWKVRTVGCIFNYQELRYWFLLLWLDWIRHLLLQFHNKLEVLSVLEMWLDIFNIFDYQALQNWKRICLDQKRRLNTQNTSNCLYIVNSTAWNIAAQWMFIWSKFLESIIEMAEQKTNVIIPASIYLGIGTLGFIANLVQMIIIGRDKKQRNSVFGITLLSLNISDIFISIVQLYRGILLVLFLLLVIDLNLVLKIGKHTDLVIIFSLASSFSHVIFIAVMRILALVFPMRIKRIITKSRCTIILFFLWLLSIGFVTISQFIIKSKLDAIL